MQAATIRSISTRSVLAWLYLGLCGVLPALAQSPAPSGPQVESAAGLAAAAARQIGICQCIDDKSALHLLRCIPGAAACQAACASPHYAFVPQSGALAQCAHNELYVVLPNADGRPGSGAISVEEAGTSTLLDRPYGAAVMLRGQKAAEVAVGASQVQTIFHRAFSARPLLPSRFVLSFPLGGVDPLPEAAAEYRKVLDDIKRRSVYQVEVIGYTDTVADAPFNEKLGLQRADRIRRNLIRDGVGAAAIFVASRGKTDLLVPTPDQVAEERNRRVEITVR